MICDLVFFLRSNTAMMSVSRNQLLAEKLTFVSVMSCKCQAKFLTCEIADFTLSAHAQSDIPGHAFRKWWLLTETSNILKTDD